MTIPATRPGERGETHVWRQLRAALAAAVEQGEIVGATVAVAHRGLTSRVLHAGLADREAGRGAAAGTIFRIASMTKPIVSAAALALVDHGRMTIDDPVTRWLPDFAPALADGSRPPISVRHLLTHTAGLGYTFTEPLDGAFHRLGVSDGLDAQPVTLDGNIARIGRAPLLFAPGTAWSYSSATDVLGAVVAAAGGDTLPVLVETLVTGPLGMADTRFHATDPGRVAAAYADRTRMADGTAVPFYGSEIRYWPSRAFDAGAWPSAGTGMVGTAPDYLRFLEALRTGGAPILSPPRAALFAADATGTLPTAAGPGFGWSLGASVLTDPVLAGLPGHAGTWGWGGVYGSHFFVDPAAELSLVCLTNTALAGMAGPFPLALRRAAYADLETVA